MALLLSREAVEPLLSLTKAIELTEDAFEQQAGEKVVAHAPYHIAVGGSKALRIVSGALLGWRRVGVRLGPNSGLGGDRMYALLFDTESGALLSVIGPVGIHPEEPSRRKKQENSGKKRLNSIRTFRKKPRKVFAINSHSVHFTAKA